MTSCRPRSRVVAGMARERSLTAKAVNAEERSNFCSISPEMSEILSNNTQTIFNLSFNTFKLNIQYSFYFINNIPQKFIILIV